MMVTEATSTQHTHTPIDTMCGVPRKKKIYSNRSLGSFNLPADMNTDEM